MFCLTSRCFAFLSTEDINQGRISYHLKDSPYPETRDEFIFKVVNDVSGTVLEGRSFLLKWSWVTFDHDSYNVSANSEVLEIPIRRTGNLNVETSVRCSYFNGEEEVSHNLVFKKETEQVPCKLNIKEIFVRNGIDSVEVRLEKASHSLVGRIKKATVSIRVEPSILSFEYSRLLVPENSRNISVKVFRTGNLDSTVSVHCVTSNRTAVGAVKGSSYHHDFVHRPKSDQSSLLVFQPGQEEAACTIDIVDDTKFESNENFYLLLDDFSSGSQLGDLSSCLITIIGPNDLSKLSLESSVVFLDIRERVVNISVARKGDLSHGVSAQCVLSSLPDQKKNMQTVDLTIPPNSSSGVCRFFLDSYNLERTPEFKVTLEKPVNAFVNNTSSVTKIVTSKPDTTTMEFEKNVIIVTEVQGFVDVPIIRKGNLFIETSVICFTRSRSAKPSLDYNERQKLKNATVIFGRGIEKASCRISLIDDNEFEDEETFLVKLAHPEGPQRHRIILGKHKLVRILIRNPEDKPSVSFKNSMYTIGAPETSRNISRIFIELERKGDLTKQSRVRIMTRDVTARSGRDYVAVDDVINFNAGQNR